MSTDNNGDSDEVLNNNPRKRKLRVDKHKRHVSRDSKVQGVQYRNWKGKIIEARRTGDNCKLSFVLNTRSIF